MSAAPSDNPVAVTGRYRPVCKVERMVSAIEALGCGGCMESLRRVSAGEYTIDEAVPLDALLEIENPEQYLRPVDSMFRNYPAVTLSPKQETRCRKGNSFTLNIAEGTYRVYGQDGSFLALSKVDNGVMSTIKSFFEV